MAAIIEQITGALKRTWECKQCHQTIGEEHTIAYHLIDGILYGWCDACFNQRPETKTAIAGGTV